MKKIPRKRWLVLLPMAAVIIILIIFTSGGEKEEYSTIDVISGPLVQTVSETGTVNPVQEVSLNFFSAGRISDIYVQVGDEVASGTPLASLDTSSLIIRRAEAEAGLKIAEASLSKIIAGASSETVAVSRSEIEQAQANESAARTDLEKIKKTVAENIVQAEKALRDLESTAITTPTPQEQAVATAATALENTKKSNQKLVDNSRSSLLLVLGDKILTGKIALDNLYTLLEDDDAENVLGVKNSSTLSDTKNSRAVALALLPTAESAVTKAKSSGTDYDLNAAATAVRNFLSKTSQALNYAYSLLEATITWAQFTQAELDAYKTLISTQSSQVSAANTAVENSVQAYNNAQVSYETAVAAAEESLRQAQVNLENAISSARNALTSARLSGDQQIAAAQARLETASSAVLLAKSRLASVSAPARAQDIALAEAQLSQAQASLASIDKQIADSLLVAPLSGVVTQVNYEAGEQFGASGQSMVQMLADNNFNINLDISESDISKVKAGNVAEITIDAFPEDLVLAGVVGFIEPAQTIIQGVVYYKLKIEFQDLAAIQEDLKARNLTLKAGMTANVSIITEKRDNVLQVPSRAVIEEEGRKFVRILSDKEVIESPVTTGLRGDDGLIEIKSGVKAGDQVITFIKNVKK